MFSNEKLSTHDLNFQSKTLWLLMYFLFSPIRGFLFCLTSKQDTLPPIQSQLPSVSYCLFQSFNCKSKTSAFCYCCSMYLFYCFLVVQLYALPTSLEQKSLKTEVLLLLSTEIDILENRRRGMNNALFPLLQLLNNSPQA